MGNNLWPLIDELKALADHETRYGRAYAASIDRKAADRLTTVQTIYDDWMATPGPAPDVQTLLGELERSWRETRKAPSGEELEHEMERNR